MSILTPVRGFDEHLSCCFYIKPDAEFITSSSETISEAHGGLITVSVFIIGGEMNNNHTKPSAYAVMILMNHSLTHMYDKAVLCHFYIYIEIMTLMFYTVYNNLINCIQLNCL